MPQLNTQSRERDNPHRAGPESLSNLCGNLVELRAVALGEGLGFESYKLR